MKNVVSIVRRLNVDAHNLKATIGVCLLGLLLAAMCIVVFGIDAMSLAMSPD
jgi:hypothetical protein